MIKESEAYIWLNKFDGENQGFLGDPISRLINQVMDAVSEDEYAKAYSLIDIVLNVSKSTGWSLEQAETHCRCGYAYYLMGNDIKAISGYRLAASYYNIVHPHNQAISNWLIGYALWRTMKFSNAIIVWEKCCFSFKQLEEVALKNKEPDQAEWYGEKGAFMCDDLAEVIKKAGQWPDL